MGFVVSTGLAVSLAVLLLLAVSRVAELERELETARENQQVRKSEAALSLSGGVTNRAEAATPRSGGRAGSNRGGNVAGAADVSSLMTGEREVQNPEQVVGQLIRALMQTEGGKRMALEESVENAEERFAPLLAEFALSDEERTHFLTLAGAELGSEDMLWMELLIAEGGDRESIMKKWEVDRKQRLEEIRNFLNNEEDWDRYLEYSDRIPEYEQMEGLREVMTEQGAPMSAEQEGQLVDLLYSARVESGMRDRWQGRGILEQLSKPGLVQRLRDDWESGVASLGDTPRQILSSQQAEIFEAVQAEMMEEMTAELSEGLRYLSPGLGPKLSPGEDR
ncbi:MAG: hypothetical protein CMO40_08115 [Verrucomicrobiaceae bacterium]|nr:hypothetical protein [Verrucomicrobiaceae bacterium]